jgi:hypothetical protein
VNDESRMTCPTCGRRDVAARNVRGPRVNRGRPIPPIRMPVRHKKPGWDAADVIAGRQWCPAGERSGR